jgi:nucleolar GTP-binding protein
LRCTNDSIDPEIEAKLDALEEEERRLEAEGFYDSDEEIVTPLLQKKKLIQRWTTTKPNSSKKPIKSAPKLPYAKMNPV